MSRERPKSHIGKSKDLPRPDKQYEKEVLEMRKVKKGNKEDETIRYARGLGRAIVGCFGFLS
jgi:hypothetical protein